MRIFFIGMLALNTGSVSANNEREQRIVLFFGDSITSGYGVAPEESYPALIQEKIDAAKLSFKAVNAGLSGDTTAAGIERLRWVLRQEPEVLVLALGGNDGLRGIPPDTTEENLQSMINLAREINSDMKIILAGMKMPPNYGLAFTNRFAAIYPRLAKKNNIALIPFLLEGVGGVADLNLPDRIHPTAEGHRLIAQTVWKGLKPVLRAKSSR